MKPYSLINIASHSPDLHEELRIAIGHIKVDEENIESSYLNTPNISHNRYLKLNHLLNDVVRHHTHNHESRIHLLVLPEVSIPHFWASVLTKWARRHQIGIVCGLEHRIHQTHFAWNELLAVLPYKAQNGLKACVPVRRLKRHYAPEEKFRLTNNSLQIPKEQLKSRYQLFRWRGASFAVYNCYELASLEDRAIFKAKVDFIICSEFNPDVNYFSNIVESAARDLHCYVVQVNSSQFGDSRIVSPSSTLKLNPVRLKGGENQTFLTMTLPLKKLRDHQQKLYGLQKESNDFKPTPPGFSRKQVRTRTNLGKTARQ